MADPLELSLAIKKLLDYWSGWEKNKKYYLEQLLPDLIRDGGASGTKEERFCVKEIIKVATTEELKNLPMIADNLEKYRHHNNWVHDQIFEMMEGNRYLEAGKFIQTHNSERNMRIHEALFNDFRSKWEKKIQDLLKSGKIEEIENLIEQVRQYLPDDTIVKANN